MGPPFTESLKLNFDGSARGKPGLAEVGGIIRNNMAIPTLSFSRPAGICSTNEAELLVVRTDLREAHHPNLSNLIVEGDSICAIQWAKDAAKAPWKVAIVVDEILDLANSLLVSFSHIDRRASSKADPLPKGASNHVWLMCSLCGVFLLSILLFWVGA